eukprot:1186934-Prorocentrum_minimum.AAC.1
MSTAERSEMWPEGDGKALDPAAVRALEVRALAKAVPGGAGGGGAVRGRGGCNTKGVTSRIVHRTYRVERSRTRVAVPQEELAAARARADEEARERKVAEQQLDEAMALVEKQVETWAAKEAELREAAAAAQAEVEEADRLAARRAEEAAMRAEALQGSLEAVQADLEQAR